MFISILMEGGRGEGGRRERCGREEKQREKGGARGGLRQHRAGIDRVGGRWIGWCRSMVSKSNAEEEQSPRRRGQL